MFPIKAQHASIHLSAFNFQDFSRFYSKCHLDFHIHDLGASKYLSKTREMRENGFVIRFQLLKLRMGFSQVIKLTAPKLCCLISL